MQCIKRLSTLQEQDGGRRQRYREGPRNFQETRKPYVALSGTRALLLAAGGPTM